MLSRFVSLAVLTAAVASQEAEIREWVGEDGLEILYDHPYTIVTFYDEKEESKEVNALMEGAKKHFEKMMEQGEWHWREVSWLRVDITKSPDWLDFPDQMVYSREGDVRRLLHFFKYSDESKEASSARLAQTIRELTGDWFLPIDCKDIQAEERDFYDEFVYFGPEEDLLPGGFGEELLWVSKMDRYYYEEQRVGFYFNSDPACADEHGLVAEGKSHVVVFNGENGLPVELTYARDEMKEEVGKLRIEHAARWEERQKKAEEKAAAAADADADGEGEEEVWDPYPAFMDYNQVELLMNLAVVQGTPRWSQRASNAMFKHYMNSLVYMMPAGSLEKFDELKADWRVALMTKITEWTQESETNYLSILAQYDSPAEEYPTLHSLAEYLQIKEDDLPMLYAVHPFSQKIVKFEEPLDDIKKVSPELIIAWAQLKDLEWTLTDFNASFYGYDDAEPDAETVKELEEAIAEQLAEFNAIKAALMQENSFHENIDEHLEVADSHINRIEASYMDEL